MEIQGEKEKNADDYCESETTADCVIVLKETK